MVPQNLVIGKEIGYYLIVILTNFLDEFSHFHLGEVSFEIMVYIASYGLSPLGNMPSNDRTD